MKPSIDIQLIQEIIQQAGELILEVYREDFSVEVKEDQSPVTIADQKANDLIVEKLKKYYPSVHFITEETKNAEFDERKSYEYTWIIDPLDGTKEFIKKNDEFTVNIALCHQQEIVFGMILVPVTGVIYYAEKGKGAYKIEGNNTTKIRIEQPTDTLKIVTSRSHRTPLPEELQSKIDTTYKNVEYVPAGSSLKLCLVAEGCAHFYPRFGPTMEWDIAAGHIIATEAGASVLQPDNHQPILFNKENLLNPYFIVSSTEL